MKNTINSEKRNLAEMDDFVTKLTKVKTTSRKEMKAVRLEIPLTDYNAIKEQAVKQHRSVTKHMVHCTLNFKD